MEDWISKSETFDGWIDSQRKQLEELLTSPEEETTLDKVLEEEIAIKVRENHCVKKKSSVLKRKRSSSNSVLLSPEVQAYCY